jgi:hypothetical protein
MGPPLGRSDPEDHRQRRDTSAEATETARQERDTSTGTTWKITR